MKKKLIVNIAALAMIATIGFSPVAANAASCTGSTCGQTKQSCVVKSSSTCNKNSKSCSTKKSTCNKKSNSKKSCTVKVIKSKCNK